MSKKIKNGLIFFVILILAFAGIKESKITTRSLSEKKIINAKEVSQNVSCLNAGSPYLINYEMEGIIDKQIWSIEQDTNGIMLFANRRGIISFDGYEWKYIKTESVPYKIKKDPVTNTIFVGCKNGPGYISKNNGIYNFETIEFDSTGTGEISEIVFNNENVYFYNENFITRVNTTDFTDKSVIPNNNLVFSGIFSYKNKIYVSVQNKGFYEVKNEFLSPVPFTSCSLNYEILFSFNISESILLLGSSDNKLYTFDGEKLLEFETDAKEFFSDNYIITGTKINDSEFALGTLDGGVLIINYLTRKSVGLINTSSGLPDNEIFALKADTYGGLWITDIFGVCRVDFNIPVKNYGNYYGLSGNIISTCLLDSVLYVVTTEGVFYLTQPKDLSELNTIQNLIKVEKSQVIEEKIEEIMTDVETSSNSENDINSNSETTEKEENKGFFKKWKDKRNKNKETDENVSETTETIGENIVETTENVDTNKIVNEVVETTETVNQNSYTYIQNYNDSDSQQSPENNKLLEFNYYFKQIEGIEEKCKQIIEFENRLILATNNGLIQIKDNEPEAIIKEKYITTIYKSKKLPALYAVNLNGIDVLFFENDKFNIKTLDVNAELLENISSIAEDNNGNLWIGTEDKATIVRLDENMNVIETLDYDFGIEMAEKIIVKNVYNQIYFFQTNGIFFFDEENQKVDTEAVFSETEKNYLKFISAQQENLWYFKNEIWYSQGNTYDVTDNQILFLNLFENIRDIKVDKFSNLWVVDGYKSIYKIEKSDTASSNLLSFRVFARNIYSDSIYYDLDKNIVLKHDNNGITIDFSAPYYLKEKSNQYQYLVEGLMNNWSEWSDKQTIALYLNSGKYKVHIKAKNVLGETSEERIFKITVKPPFWETSVFWIIVGLVFVIIIVLFSRMRQKALIKRNQLLEQKVTERTLEITLQKEEIESQRDELKYQRDLATNQRDMITIQTKQITDSIEYARRIQTAILPLSDSLMSFFGEYFIINMPKDVVSGDFYFLKQDGNKFIVAVADCTGHGVPGAFLSMMGVAYLNEIVAKTEKLYANEILNTLRQNIIDSLHQSETNERKDGMDISLCIFDKEINEAQFAGAYNSLLVFRENDIVEVVADKMPVGYHRKKDIAFTSHLMSYKNDDIFYLFSDGYVDQFGGKHGRKFLKGNFKELLLTIGELSLSEQKDIIVDSFKDWKGDYSQVDDIMVLGVKI